MEKMIIIKNEKHSLMDDQKRALDEFIQKRLNVMPEISTLPVPESGWTKEDMEEIMKKNFSHGEWAVFVSPIPYMISRLAWSSGAWGVVHELNHKPDDLFCSAVLVFHNDKREAKEIPDGKGGVRMIHSVAPTGWILV